MSGARRPAALRVAAIGAALSLAGAIALPPLRAADRPVAPPGAPQPPASPARPQSPPRADDAAAIDDALLEFLGSVGDPEEAGDWLDFLTNTDIDKVAKRGAKAPPRGK